MKSNVTVRGRLKKLPGLRSAVYLAIVLRQMLADEWRDPDSFDRVFSADADPWRSDSEAERLRFATTLAVLEASGRDHFRDAVELGCAEGVFTERMAPRCEVLTALDFSDVALSRARKRLSSAGNVTFQRWDMRQEPVPGPRELVIAMGVITSLYRPRDVRRVAEAVIAAIRPGGFLLFSDVRQSRVFESAWWGRLVLRGGEQIRRLLTRHPQLELIKAADTDSHVFALYRRPAADT